jgi:Ca-activated chloride channel family protein
MRLVKVCLVACCIVMLTGCSLVIEKIQQVTGNEIQNVNEKKTDIRNQASEEKQIYEEKYALPTTSTVLRNIIEDEGKGKYATTPYQEDLVKEALHNMPDGLSVDAAYAYLLGLVGQNYKYDLEQLSSILPPNFTAKQRVIMHEPVNVKPPKGKPATAVTKTSNVTVLIDAGSTMADNFKGKSRFAWAQQFTTTYLRQLPANTTVTVRLFGSEGGPKKADKQESCTKLPALYHGNLTNLPTLEKSLAQSGPVGWTPLVEALRLTVEDLKKQQKPNVENFIYVVADSSDTCGEDVNTQIEQIRNSDLGVMVNVVGVDVPAKDEKELTQLAEQTGGEYHFVDNADDVNKVASISAQEVKQVNDPWQLRLLQKVVNGYKATQKRLDKNYEVIVNNLDDERKRLTEANDMIKQDKKINELEHQRIKGWIDSRYKGVLGFTEQKWQAKKAEIKQSFSHEVEEMDKKWQQHQEQLKPYEAKKTQLLNEAKQMIQESTPEQGE